MRIVQKKQTQYDKERSAQLFFYKIIHAWKRSWFSFSNVHTYSLPTIFGENHTNLYCMKNVRFKRMVNARNICNTKLDINGHDGNFRNEWKINICQHFCDRWHSFYHSHTNKVKIWYFSIISLKDTIHLYFII